MRWQQTSSRWWALLGALLCSLPVIAVLPGCGGSSITNSTGNTNSYAGNYTGRVTLNGGQSGLLAMNVQSTGLANGTLTVTSGGALVAQAAPGNVTTRAIIATAALTGNVNPNSGAFSLSGTITLNGANLPVNITGVLPKGTVGGTFAAQIGTNTFNGTITLPTTAPTPTPTQNGTNSCDNGAVSGTFSAAQGTSATTSALQLTNNSGTLQAPASGTGNAGTLNIASATCVTAGSASSRGLNIRATNKPGAITPGSYPLGTAAAQSVMNGGLSYVESTLNNGAPITTETWTATGGTLVIDSITGNIVRFHITSATMTPTLPGTNATPTGTFTINASGAVAVSQTTG